MYAGWWDDDTVPCVHLDEDTDDMNMIVWQQNYRIKLITIIFFILSSAVSTIIAIPNFTQFYPGIDLVEIIIIWCDLFTDDMR